MSAGEIIIRSKDRTRSIYGWLTDQAPTVSGGYGGWQSQPRPRKASLTVWQGREPFTLTVPILLDRQGDSVAGDIHDLDVLSSGTSQGAPPVVTIDGPVPAPEHAGSDWVIQDITWGDRLLRRDQVVVRQQVTVTLLEYVDDKLLAASTLRSRTPGGGQVIRHHRVTAEDVKPHHGLLRIAARELGDAKRWTDIAALNGLRSSGQLRVGMLLRLP